MEKNKEIKILIDGKEVDLFDFLGEIYPLKQGDFFFKKDGRWYLHKLVFKDYEEDKKIEKLDYGYLNSYGNKSYHKQSELEIIDKINEIIDAINKEEK